MDAVRSGLLGGWDRLVGPGATASENVGTIGLGLVGALLAPQLSRAESPCTGLSTPRRDATVCLLALDLWGGAWCNNTASAARWYHRDGQGFSQHLAFASAHMHPFVLAWLDRDGGDSRARWRWAAAQYGYLLLATALVASRRPEHRRRTGLLTTVGGAFLDQILGPSPAAPWFGPVYFTKLLAGHVAGAALLPHDPLVSSAKSANR